MENLLNRGFNFSILPLKLDLTQVLVDFKRFERSVIWYEFFYGSESDGELKPKIFKNNTNLEITCWSKNISGQFKIRKYGP